MAKTFKKITYFFSLSTLAASLMLHNVTFADSSVLQTPEDPISPTYPTPIYTEKSDKTLIAKGEYLVKMGDCIACHTNTPANGQAFTGNLPFDTPFGTFYSQNITPDKETGIGNWSDQDFINALRHGISPQGDNYYPVFPYVYFNRLSDQDILAIKAYLFSLPPIRQETNHNKVMFPFNIRVLQTGWKILFFNFHKGELKEDPSQSAEWNRGRYIVDGLGHCAMCHSPMNPFGASKTNLYLGGAFVNGYYAPNITSATLADHTVPQLVDVFKNGKLLEGGKVKGPMAEVVNDSLHYLSDEDLAAMATYLKTVKPIYAKKKKLTGTTEQIGKKLYKSTCATCHEKGVAGAPIVGDVAAWAPRIKLGEETLYKNAIEGINSMPPKGTCLTCTNAQIQAAVDYMVEHSKEGQADTAVAVHTTAPPKFDTSVALGKTVYEKNCASCHTPGSNGATKLGDTAAWVALLKDQEVDNLFIKAETGHTGLPKNSACSTCSGSEIEAAVKYMLQEAKTAGNYDLW